MFLPTEYMLRKQRTSSMLELPCSLFLRNVKNVESLKGKVILTIHTYSSEKVWVCRYDLERFQSGRLPIPFSECFIEKSDIFTSDFVIIPDHKPLIFTESPYTYQGKQEAAMPQATLQEKEYVDTVDKFYTSKLNSTKREEWLWAAFDKLNVAAELRSKYYGNTISIHQETIRLLSPNLWKLWESWCKMFLIGTGPATELVFGPHYQMPVPYTEIPEPEERDSLQQFVFENSGFDFLNRRDADRRRIRRISNSRYDDGETY